MTPEIAAEIDRVTKAHERFSAAEGSPSGRRATSAGHDVTEVTASQGKARRIGVRTFFHGTESSPT